MKILSKGISKKISKKIGLYKFEVGILKNEPKKLRKEGSQKNYAGMRVSATGKTSKDVSLVEVAETMDNLFGWLRKPFNLSQNKDINEVVKEISSQTFGKKSANNKRLENAVQGIIRNPILRGDYGNNSEQTIKQKGFNKLGVDTAQLFKNIKAKRI